MSTPPVLRNPTRVIEGFIDSTDLLGQPDALRARAAEEGYLYFRRFLPPEPLLELRGEVLGVMHKHGWLKEGTDLMDGIADLEALALSDQNFSAGITTGVAYADIQKLEHFHALPHHPRILALYRDLLDAEVFPHPRHIARVLPPTPDAAATPPHQDYLYIQGTHQFWTLWFPLGDCPVELGGLSVLRGSHREPVLDVVAADGAGGRESNLCGKDYAWVQGDYALGDIITFPSHMVHKGLPNQLGDRTRLSLDLRYQPADEPLEVKSLRPHMDVATWEEIYAGWESDKLKYYWRQQELEMSPWDDSLLKSTERIC